MKKVIYTSYREDPEITEEWDRWTPYSGGTYRVSYGYDSMNTNSPRTAISTWFRMQKKYPQDVQIMCQNKEDAIRLNKAATPEFLAELNSKYYCPYKLEYLISESAKEVEEGQPYFHYYEDFGDSIHPFDLG